MKIYLDESPPASGKSERVLRFISKHQYKFLFIVEKVERFAELTQDINKFASAEGRTPTVEVVQSNQGFKSVSVSQTIATLPFKYAGHKHVIVLATHAAMLRGDFSGFSDWQMIVDEAPQILDFEEKRTHLDAEFFKKYYDLVPFEDGWTVVTLSEEGKGLTAGDVRADESHSHLTVFHSRVIEASRDDSTRYVLCNLPEWDAMKGRKVSWCWASVFSFWELKPFKRVVFLGNRFRNDVGSILSETMTLEPIKWVTLPPVVQKSEFMQRFVHIHYFSEHRRSSRCCFESQDGQKMLGEIGAYLSNVLPSGYSIWTANDTAADQTTMTPKQAMITAGLCGMQYLSPRQAGTNSQMRNNHAAMIYSAKPSPNLIALLKILHIPVEKWAQSVEHETILQFMSRTSVRDRDNTSAVHMWVFDRDQALYLKEHFDSLMHVTATMQFVEDGPAIPAQSKRGPKAVVRTAAEQAEFDAARRRKDAERNKRNRAIKKKVAKMREAA